MHAVSATVLARANVKERSGHLGFDIIASTPEALAAQIDVCAAK